MSNTQSWRRPGTRRSIAELRRLVGDFAAGHGVPVERVHDIELAVSEALNNAVIHGYRDGPGGDLRVEIETNDELLVTVVDHGCGMGPRTDSPGLRVGLALIGALATRYSISSAPEGRGTQVRIAFALTSVDPHRRDPAGEARVSSA
jgi:anti-sigma regulatory factor (Ser/Thr protein kinase)